MLEYIVLLAVLLVLSALFSASETAYYSVSRITVEHLVKKKVKGAEKLKIIKEKQNKFLVTILLLNNVVNIGAATIAASIVASIFPENVAIAISTFVMTLLVLIFGEITPKSFASKHSIKLALFFSGFLYFLMVILSPLTFLLDKLTVLLVGSAKQTLLTEEEVKMVISLGLKEGAIDQEEKQLIHNVFRLDDVSVGEIMTPRVDMISIEKDKTLKQLKSFLKETPYSRIPVVDEETEEVVGIFSVRKAMEYLGRKLDVRVSSLMEEPLFVPLSKKIGSLLKEFQEKKVHIAVVVGEYGGVQGLVTLEDIFEELVGEITEKKDDEYEMQIINEKTIIVEGGTELTQINDELEIKLRSKEFNTIAGFLLEKLDRVPKKGEKINVNGIKIEIIKAKKNKIEKVKITK